MTATTLSPKELASRIQSTLLDVGVHRDQIVAHCEECVRYGFNAAMVPGRWVRLAGEVLEGTDVLVASAIDFPLGAMTMGGKVAEACALVAAGAEQLDIGVPIGAIIDGEHSTVHRDIAAVVDAVAPVPVKAMLELPLLTPSQRDTAVDLAVDAGVRWVKNASGGAVGVATEEDMRYLRGRAPSTVGVKASGGIRSHDQALALLQAGADLMGTSAAVAIATGGADTRATY